MKNLKFELKIVVAYLIAGGIWILFSDKLLNYLIRDAETIARVQTYKGWFYVVITAMLFYSFLKKHLVKLRNAERRARESDRLKTAFLHNISHEIRTPMNGIIGFTELLHDKNLTESEKKQYISTITNSSYRLLETVNQILDISLIESGNLVIREQKVNLNRLIREYVSVYTPLVNTKTSLSYTTSLNDDNCTILSDESKLRMIMNNLIGNAVKFTEEGFIRFGYRHTDEQLEFYVEDSGIGINEETLGSIFTRFQKPEWSNGRFYEGMGLGLAICKETLELMKGSINVTSKQDEGSVFRFTIPYTPAPVEEEIRAVAPPDTYSDLKGLVLLIVEDDDSNYRYIREIFQHADFQILRAENGRKAVDLCTNNPEINMVLMDIRLPGLNGYDATRLIKAVRPELPVIAQTAYALAEEPEHAADAGCNDYISKPFRKTALINLIRKHLNFQHGDQPDAELKPAE